MLKNQFAQMVDQERTIETIYKSNVELSFLDHLRSAPEKEIILDGKRKGDFYITERYIIVLKDCELSPAMFEEANKAQKSIRKSIALGQKSVRSVATTAIENISKNGQKLIECSDLTNAQKGEVVKYINNSVRDVSSRLGMLEAEISKNVKRLELKFEEPIPLKAGSVLVRSMKGEKDCLWCPTFIYNHPCPAGCAKSTNILVYTGKENGLIPIYSLAQQKGWNLNRTYAFCGKKLGISRSNPYSPYDLASNIYQDLNPTGVSEDPSDMDDTAISVIPYRNEWNECSSVVYTLFNIQTGMITFHPQSFFGYDGSENVILKSLPLNAFADEYTPSQNQDMELVLTESLLFYYEFNNDFNKSSICLNSWFGGTDNLKYVDLYRVEGKVVTLFIHPHSGLDRETRLKSALRQVKILSSVKGVKLTIREHKTGVFTDGFMEFSKAKKLTATEFIKSCEDEGVTVSEIPASALSLSEFEEVTRGEVYVQPFWGQTKVLHAFSDDPIRLGYFISLCSTATLTPEDCGGLVAKTSSVTLMTATGRSEVMQEVIENSFSQELKSHQMIFAQQVDEGKIRGHLQTLEDYFKDSSPFVILFLSESFMADEYDRVMRHISNFPEKRFLLVIESSNPEFVRKTKRRYPSTVTISESSSDEDSSEVWQEGDNIEVDDSCFDILYSNKKLQAYREDGKWLVNHGE